jgi:hypothetical protein
LAAPPSHHDRRRRADASAIVFAWPYTTLLIDYAFSRGMDLLARTMIVVVFLGGAWAGGASVGRFKLRGALGLPLLQPNAFAAYATMIIVIPAGFVLQRHLGARAVSQ